MCPYESQETTFISFLPQNHLGRCHSDVSSPVAAGSEPECCCDSEQSKHLGEAERDRWPRWQMPSDTDLVRLCEATDTLTTHSHELYPYFMLMQWRKHTPKALLSPPQNMFSQLLARHKLTELFNELSPFSSLRTENATA